MSSISCAESYSSFLIISLETYVTDDFMNSNRNLVKPTRATLVLKRSSILFWVKVWITSLDRKGLENRFNIFLRQRKITRSKYEIGLRTRSIMRTFNFMDQRHSKEVIFFFAFWYPLEFLILLNKYPPVFFFLSCASLQTRWVIVSDAWK